MAAAKKPYDYLIKLLLIGDSGVGKSCLLLRFFDDSFTHNFISTIGIDFKVKTIDVAGKKVKLQIWDTAGQERFHTITTAYYHGAHGMVLIYDVSDEKTFDNVRHWMKQIETHCQSSVNRIIIANKCDIADRVITKQRGEQLATELGVKFFETSAKSNQNVTEAFLAITTDIAERFTAEGSTGVVSKGGIKITPDNTGAAAAGGGGDGGKPDCCGGTKAAAKA